jgi:REP element-mobilizing transposase RayT
MSTGYQIKDQFDLHYLTFQVVNWVDLFTRRVYKDIVIESFKYMMDNKGFQLFAYVIMSNHIHLIAQSIDGNLSDNIRDIKKFTSVKIIETIILTAESRKEWMLNVFKSSASQRQTNKYFQVWTHENHAILIYSNEFIREKIEYIHNNPVRAGIVENPEDYLYSSARNYARLNSLVDIPLLTIPWHTFS